jgi:DNA polymerase-1
MIRVDAALHSERPKAKLLLQVHDELIAETPEKEAAAVAALMKREMEGAIELSLALRASVETGKRWGDMH